MSNWVVIKFGGTSVSTRGRWETIASVAQARVKEGLRPLVVCSALSGISNQLEALLASTLDGTGSHEAIVEAIAARHVALGEELEVDTQEVLGASFAELRRLATGASLVGEVSPRLHARILAQGELMSTRLGAAFLAKLGLPVAWQDARACLDAAADPNGSERRRFLSAVCPWERDPELEARLDAIDAQIVLTQGFIARDEEGRTVLLGRGGSDTSAAYFAARVGAVRCEIWTDVPGMYTANPHEISAARMLKLLEYDEAQEIASTGAKVLHPRAIAPLRAHDIPLQIRCTLFPEMSGTTISSESTFHGAQVKAISAKAGITLVSMNTNAMWQQVGFLADIFNIFKTHGLSIDLVSTSEMNVTVSLDPAANALEPSVIERLLVDLSKICRASRIGPCAAISLVGRNIRGILHKLGPVLAIFEEQKVHLVSQAASDLNLTFVVDEEQATRLVKRLHTHLFEGADVPFVLGPTWQETFASEGDKVEQVETTPRWWEQERASLVQLAAAGSPRYVYKRALLRQHAESLLALSNLDRVLYAIKANANVEILDIFHEAGLGFECVSPGEVTRILERYGDKAKSKVLFTPNFAPRAEYAFGFERGVQVTLDNLHPLESWPELFAGEEIFVRMDPGQGRGHHDYVRTAGAYSKFGISASQLDRLEALVKSTGARVTGLHAHTGSGIRTPDNWQQTAIYLAHVAQRFPETRVLDLGGGLGVPERPEHTPLDLQALDASLAPFRAAHPRFELWMEPGRFLVADAGVLLATCTQLKQKGELLYVGIDAGMNSLIRPALYGAHHEIVNLSRLGDHRTLVANIVGPICESGDTLGYSRRIPITREGDVFLIATAGAYGRSMASEYNLRRPAEEVMVD